MHILRPMKIVSGLEALNSILEVILKFLLSLCRSDQALQCVWEATELSSPLSTKHLSAHTSGTES
jgi:hypothetical protein